MTLTHFLTDSLTHRRGQSTMEYALVIAVVIGALLAMQFYMKRGVQGKLRSSADEIGEAFSPTAYKAIYKTTQTSNTKETLQTSGQKIGESKTETTGAKGYSTERKLDGNEQLTDAEADDKDK